MQGRFYSLRCEQLDDERVVLVAPDAFTRDLIREDYLPALLDAVEQQTGFSPRVEWVIRPLVQQQEDADTAPQNPPVTPLPRDPKPSQNPRMHASPKPCIRVQMRENSAPLNEYMILRAFETLGMQRPTQEQLNRTWNQLSRLGAKEGHLDYGVHCTTLRKGKGVAFDINEMAYLLGIIRRQQTANGRGPARARLNLEPITASDIPF